jgi:extracellular factor (EF) 3-hydroxypalmitic acid methyl ester biosynthesis protein
MNHPVNGIGTESRAPASQPKPELTHAQVGATLSEISGIQVTFQTADGVTQRGAAIRVARHNVVFELFSADTVPHFSESLKDFQVVSQNGTLYSGRAVVNNLVNDGIRIAYEVSLDEFAWSAFSFAVGQRDRQSAHAKFGNFLQEWQKVYGVNQEYKVAIADLQTFMTQLRLWLHQAELKISNETRLDHDRIANEIVMELRAPVIAALNNLYERFEVVSQKIGPDLLPAHRAYGRQQLHPLVLGSPFLHRTYTKPLGYAGDYEMMNMIVRNGLEGKSIFAKLINAHLLDQPPCRAVRNRVGYLNARIIEEASRLAIRRAGVNIFCVACGPAWEAVNFVADHPLANQASIELLDFNEETLRRTEKNMAQTIQKHNRRTKVKTVKNSVQNLLRNKGRRAGEFDLVYCSGLYDYLSDSVCLALNNQLYEMLAPGGLLVVGNFATDTPGRNLMEHLMDWFLIYRNQRELLALAPEPAGADNCRVRSEAAAANLFLEARKPR